MMTSWKFYLFYNHCQLDHCSKNHNLCCSKLILHPLLPIVSSVSIPILPSEIPFFSPSKSQVLSQKSNSSSQKSNLFPKKHPNPMVLDPKKPLHPLLQESPSWAIRLDDRLGTGLFQLLHCVLSNKTRGPDFFWWRSSTKTGRYRDFRSSFEW